MLRTAKVGDSIILLSVTAPAQAWRSCYSTTGESGATEPRFRPSPDEIGPGRSLEGCAFRLSKPGRKTGCCFRNSTRSFGRPGTESVRLIEVVPKCRAP